MVAPGNANATEYMQREQLKCESPVSPRRRPRPICPAARLHMLNQSKQAKSHKGKTPDQVCPPGSLEGGLRAPVRNYCELTPVYDPVEGGIPRSRSPTKASPFCTASPYSRKPCACSCPREEDFCDINKIYPNQPKPPTKKLPSPQYPPSPQPSPIYPPGFVDSFKKISLEPIEPIEGCNCLTDARYVPLEGLERIGLGKTTPTPYIKTPPKVAKEKKQQPPCPPPSQPCPPSTEDNKTKIIDDDSPEASPESEECPGEDQETGAYSSSSENAGAGIPSEEYDDGQQGVAPCPGPPNTSFANAVYPGFNQTYECPPPDINYSALNQTYALPQNQTFTMPQNQTYGTPQGLPYGANYLNNPYISPPGACFLPPFPHVPKDHLYKTPEFSYVSDGAKSYYTPPSVHAAPGIQVVENYSDRYADYSSEPSIPQSLLDPHRVPLTSTPFSPTNPPPLPRFILSPITRSRDQSTRSIGGLSGQSRSSGASDGAIRGGFETLEYSPEWFTPKLCAKSRARRMNRIAETFSDIRRQATPDSMPVSSFMGASMEGQYGSYVDNAGKWRELPRATRFPRKPAETPCYK